MSADPYQHFIEVAQRDGVATSSTSDGFLFLFKRSHLEALLLSNTSPVLTIGIKDGSGQMQSVQLDRTHLQMELEAYQDREMVIILYTHQPIKN